MSWQAYVDDSLLGSKNIYKGAIFSAAGDSVWAASPDFKIAPSEVQGLISGYQDSSSLWSKGFSVEGNKYFCIKADDKIIHGKKGKEGIVCVKTKQALIIGYYPDAVQPPTAEITVENLGNYLVAMNY